MTTKTINYQAPALYELDVMLEKGFAQSDFVAGSYDVEVWGDMSDF